MKIQITALFFLISFLSFGQFPSNPPSSNPGINQQILGAITVKKGIVVGYYFDTTAANNDTYVKGVGGLIINTITGLWKRSIDAKIWEQITTGSSLPGYGLLKIGNTIKADTLYVKTVLNARGDSLALVAIISQKLKNTDTSFMLLPYVTKAGYGLLKSEKTFTVDSLLIKTVNSAQQDNLVLASLINNKTLQEVTTAGNTSTRNIVIIDSVQYSTTLEVKPFGLDFNKRISRAMSHGTLAQNFAFGDSISNYLPATSGTLINKVNGIPSDMSGNVNLPPPTLQEVTTAGSITTNDVTIDAVLKARRLNLWDDDDGGYDKYFLKVPGSNFLQFTGPAGTVFDANSDAIALTSYKGQVTRRTSLLFANRQINNQDNELQLPDSSGTVILRIKQDSIYYEPNLEGTINLPPPTTLIAGYGLKNILGTLKTDTALVKTVLGARRDSLALAARIVTAQNANTLDAVLARGNASSRIINLNNGVTETILKPTGIEISSEETTYNLVKGQSSITDTLAFPSTNGKFTIPIKVGGVEADVYGNIPLDAASKYGLSNRVRVFSAFGRDTTGGLYYFNNGYQAVLSNPTNSNAGVYLSSENGQSNGYESGGLYFNFSDETIANASLSNGQVTYNYGNGTIIREDALNKTTINGKLAVTDTIFSPLINTGDISVNNSGVQGFGYELTFEERRLFSKANPETDIFNWDWLDQRGHFRIGSLDQSISAPTIIGTPQMVVACSDGLLSRQPIPSAIKDTFYILATGQSNSAGFPLNVAGTGSPIYTNPNDTLRDARVQGYDTLQNKWVTIISTAPATPPMYSNFHGISSQYMFAKKLARERNIVVRIVNYPLSGTSIEAWHSGTVEGQALKNIRRITTGIGIKSYDLIIWDQGETSGAVPSLEYYRIAFDSVKRSFRTFTSPTTPIVAIGMPRPYQGANIAYMKVDPVLQGLDKNDDPWDGYANTDSAKLNDLDRIHFNVQGLKNIGEETVWQAWKSLPTTYGSFKDTVAARNGISTINKVVELGGILTKKTTIEIPKEQRLWIKTPTKPTYLYSPDNISGLIVGTDSVAVDVPGMVHNQGNAALQILKKNTDELGYPILFSISTTGESKNGWLFRNTSGAGGQIPTMYTYSNSTNHGYVHSVVAKNNPTFGGFFLDVSNYDSMLLNKFRPVVNSNLFSVSTANQFRFAIRDDGRIILGGVAGTNGQSIVTDSLGMTKWGTAGGYTVATLPAGTLGMEAFVTDATAPTYLGALTGGGTIKCPVFYNGSIWVSH